MSAKASTVIWGDEQKPPSGLSSGPCDSEGVTRASGAGAVGASGDGCEVAKEVGHLGPRERVQRASQAYLIDKYSGTVLCPA